MTMVRSNTDLLESGAVSDSGTISYRSGIVLFVLCEA